MTLSYYLAASFTSRLKMRSLVRAIDDATEGRAVCNSLWLKDQHTKYAGDSVAEAARMAERDIRQVVESDFFVLSSLDPGTKGGRHTELGAALATGKKIFMVGPTEQVFHNHPRIVRCGGLISLLQAVRKHVDREGDGSFLDSVHRRKIRQIVSTPQTLGTLFHIWESAMDDRVRPQHRRMTSDGGYLLPDHMANDILYNDHYDGRMMASIGDARRRGKRLSPNQHRWLKRWDQRSQSKVA